jgi:hypothetical protein
MHGQRTLNDNDDDDDDKKIFSPKVARQGRIIKLGKL